MKNTLINKIGNIALTIIFVVGLIVLISIAIKIGITYS